MKESSSSGIVLIVEDDKKTAAHRYLVWASLFALALSGILSLLLTKRVLNPLSQMTRLTGKIASGDYAERIHISSKDEVAQVAAAFNRMVDNLQRVEQLRKTMIVDVAHELRTPLTNMRGYLEALMDGVTAASAETFASLHEETLRLTKLIDDLLELAKADASRTTLRPQRITLPELIAQSLELFRSHYDIKGIALETNYAEGTERVRADPDKLKQVVRNLLQNAFQYTPQGERLGSIPSACLERLRRPLPTFAETFPRMTSPLFSSDSIEERSPVPGSTAARALASRLLRNWSKLMGEKLGPVSSPAKSRSGSPFPATHHPSLDDLYRIFTIPLYRL